MEITQTPDRTLSVPAVEAIIDIPVEKITLTDWLLHLPKQDYQQYFTANTGAGKSVIYPAEPFSVLINNIGNALMVQHQSAIGKLALNLNYEI